MILEERFSSTSRDLKRSDATVESVIEKGLPVRGQKTKTNARTCKGPKRTVANKKK